VRREGKLRRSAWRREEVALAEPAAEELQELARCPGVSIPSATTSNSKPWASARID